MLEHPSRQPWISTLRDGLATVLLVDLTLTAGCQSDCTDAACQAEASLTDTSTGSTSTPTSTPTEGAETESTGPADTESGGVGIERPDRPIEGQYIFVLDESLVASDEVAGVAEALLGPHAAVLLATYDGVLTGFAANLLDDTKALVIAEDPRVVGIVQDGLIELDAIQDNAPWGLDRIDSKEPDYDWKYEYHATGEGVHAYILDTGIRATHLDFGGRVGTGFSAVNDGMGPNDCQGHGTHVAGTVGGAQYGVAKAVTLHPVRVLNCQGSGSTSIALAGIEWVLKNHQKPAVINMSLGGGASQLFDNGIKKAVDAGITVVVAAGNEDQDACTTSPARAPSAMTVGATDESDFRTSFSNWGACVDLFAPGRDIESAVHTADTGSKSSSGTSMAAPHVAGVVALYLQEHPTATPTEVSEAVLGGATAGIVGDVKGSTNKLLYSLLTDAAGPPSSFKGQKIWLDAPSNADGWYAEERRYGSIRYADLDGDQRDDVCAYAADGVRCALSNGADAFGAFAPWAEEFNAGTGWNPDSHWTTLRFPDVDGDGKADLCGRGVYGIACALSDGTNFLEHAFWTDAFANDGVWESSPHYYATIQYPDLDGDGKADVCGRGPDGVVCAVSTGTAFAAPSIWIEDYLDSSGWTAEAYWKTIRFPDLDGDGKADVCGRGIAGMACALSTGAEFGASSVWTTEFADNGVWESDAKYYETIEFADLNGDGKADVCGRGVDQVVCALSSGTNFAASSGWNDSYRDSSGWGNDSAYWATLRFQDLNGDGKADICGRGHDGMRCAVSSGTAFVNLDTWSATFADTNGWHKHPSYWSTIRFPDLDGDGSADICGRGVAGLNCALARP